MKKNLPICCLIAALTMFAVSEPTPAQTKRVVPSSFSLPLDDEKTDWTQWTRTDSTRWRARSNGGGDSSRFRVVKAKATLNGVVGTVLRSEPRYAEYFIPDMNSGSTWVGTRVLSTPIWNPRWQQYSNASTKPLPVGQPKQSVKQTEPASPDEFLEAIRGNRISDVRRMLGQDRSLSNASGKIRHGSSSYERFTPLDAAIHFQRLEIARLLLQRGASRKNLNSFLLTNVRLGREEFVRLLVGFGASLEAKNGDEDTAIFVAVRRDNLKMAKLLKSLGANLRAQNNRGYTPSEYATLIRNPVMADLLRPR